MAELTSEQQHFIVKSLACYQRPVHIITAFKEAFGVDIPSEQVAYYNPDNLTSNLSEELTALFRETRARYNAELDTEPFASRRHRIRWCYDMAVKHEKNPVMVLQFLQQAQKEADAIENAGRRAAQIGAAVGAAAGAVAGALAGEGEALALPPGVMTALLGQLNDALEAAEAEVIESQFVPEEGEQAD